MLVHRQQPTSATSHIEEDGVHFLSPCPNPSASLIVIIITFSFVYFQNGFYAHCRKKNEPITAERHSDESKLHHAVSPSYCHQHCSIVRVLDDFSIRQVAFKSFFLSSFTIQYSYEHQCSSSLCNCNWIKWMRTSRIVTCLARLIRGVTGIIFCCLLFVVCCLLLYCRYCSVVDYNVIPAAVSLLFLAGLDTILWWAPCCEHDAKDNCAHWINNNDDDASINAKYVKLFNTEQLTINSDSSISTSA
jgi:hypothetical protein